MRKEHHLYNVEGKCVVLPRLDYSCHRTIPTSLAIANGWCSAVSGALYLISYFNYRYISSTSSNLPGVLCITILIPSPSKERDILPQEAIWYQPFTVVCSQGSHKSRIPDKRIFLLLLGVFKGYWWKITPSSSLLPAIREQIIWITIKIAPSVF